MEIRTGRRGQILTHITSLIKASAFSEGFAIITFQRKPLKKLERYKFQLWFVSLNTTSGTVSLQSDEMP